MGANQNVGITVHAVDEDQGLNGEIRYEFIQNPSDRYQDWRSFHIDSQSGVITTAINIDREAQLVYFVSIVISITLYIVDQLTNYSEQHNAAQVLPN